MPYLASFYFGQSKVNRYLTICPSLLSLPSASSHYFYLTIALFPRLSRNNVYLSLRPSMRLSEMRSSPLRSADTAQTGSLVPVTSMSEPRRRGSVDIYPFVGLTPSIIVLDYTILL